MKFRTILFLFLAVFANSAVAWTVRTVPPQQEGGKWISYITYGQGAVSTSMRNIFYASVNDIIKTTTKQDESTAEVLKWFGIDAFVSVDEVRKIYGQNEVKGDQLYKGRILLIKPVISQIKSGPFDQPNIWLKDGREFGESLATFKSPDIERISELKKGQQITLICKGNGEVIGHPTYNNCRFADELYDEWAQLLADGYVKEWDMGPEPPLFYGLGMFFVAMHNLYGNECAKGKAECLKAMTKALSRKKGEKEALITRERESVTAAIVNEKMRQEIMATKK